MSFDVIIAGAGPAGIATAVALVRNHGLLPQRLLVLDRARFPRPKPCGGGLTGHALTGLSALGLELRVPSVPAVEGEVIFGSLRRAVTLGKPVHIVRRDDFDADLVAQARERGIEVREGQGISAHTVDVGTGTVSITTTDGQTLQARVLVGADGVGSQIRKELARKELKRQQPAHEQRRPGGEQNTQQPLRLARLELPAPPGFPPRMIYDFTPFADGLRGYVWLFPVPGGRINVGIMHYPASDLGGRALDRILANCLQRHGIDLPGPARGWPAWTYDARAPIAGQHVICVGDAAGIDALTGEGIAVGLESGPLAAAAIASALGRGDFAFAGYRRALRRAVVGRELALDGRLARLLYGSANWQSWLGLVFFDRRMLALYAARVSGSEVLADRKRALIATFLRHLLFRRSRRRLLIAAAQSIPAQQRPHDPPLRAAI